MVNKVFIEKINHYSNKLNFIAELSKISKLKIIYDRLNSEESVDQELLYFKINGEEKKGIFLFSYKYFIKELNDHEFKRILGRKNMLNIIIFNAYKLLEKNGFAKISDILNYINKNFNEFNYVSKNNVLNRILTLAYYHNWDLRKTEDEIDSDFFISIPDNFSKLKQRFNLENFSTIVDNSKYFFFLNGKGDLCFIFKDKDKFNKVDVEKALELISKELDIKSIEFIN